MKKVKKILILIPYYFPGHRSGGPQQTVRNLVEAFGTKAEFYIYTQNHDYGVNKPYQGIKCGVWVDQGVCKVMYVSSKEYCGRALEVLYKKFDIIYSCGLFEKNSIALMVIHKKRKISSKKIYIAPMGVFSKGAMEIKHIKKKIFIDVFKALKMFGSGQIIWSFTSVYELADAVNVLGKNVVMNYIIAEDLPRKIDFSKQLNMINTVRERDKTLKVVFLSRICPKKNLAYCGDVLKTDFEIPIYFDVYGPIEDKKYWEDCQKIFKSLPDKVRFCYCGEVSPDKVVDLLSKYDVFLFPTKGENFGHVIYEALSAGCIPIISDTTPWKEFDKYGCGLIVELKNAKAFQDGVRAISELDPANLLEMKKNAIEFAQRKYITSLNESGYWRLFDEME